MEKKTCNKCNGEFDIEEFPFKNKNKGTKYPWCHECHKKYRREYYHKNKDVVLGQDTKTRKNRRTNKRQYLWDFYKKTGCIDCGINNPIVLQCDHKGDVEKKKNISEMIAGNWSLDNLILEIGKCEVRCANCHHIRTSEQQNWYKDITK